jgi:hypothetical protein
MLCGEKALWGKVIWGNIVFEILGKCHLGKRCLGKHRLGKSHLGNRGSTENSSNLVTLLMHVHLTSDEKRHLSVCDKPMAEGPCEGDFPR